MFLESNKYKEGDRITISLQNGKYKFITPAIPHHTEILFDSEEPVKQFWRRTPFPTQEEWNEKSLQEKMAFRDREILRRLHGVWFWNYQPKLGYSVPVFLTGHNYFYLQYFKIPKAGYPKHRKFQREFFYFIDLTEKSVDCDGEAVVKTRRGGITGVYSATDLNIATLNPEVDIALQNKALDDAKKVNLYNIAFALDHIPYLDINGEQALLPKASKITATQIIFGLPRAQITSGKGSVEAEKKRKATKAMNSRIIVLPTTSNKDDTYTLFRSRKDEISKYPVQNKVDLLQEVAVLSTKRDGAPYGKLSFFSSSFEEDSYNFLAWRKIYLDSNPLNLLPNGKTKSGLWNYFIPAIYAMNDVVAEKEGRQLFDEYGDCDEAYAELYIRTNMYAPYASDPRALQAKKREYPISEDDALSLGTAVSCFDPIRLNEAILHLEDLEQRHQLFQGRYKLDWVNPAEVKATQNDEGYFEFLYNIPSDLRNRVKRHEDGRLMPYADTPFIVAIDCTSYVDQVKGGGSKNAITAGSLPDVRIEGGGNMVHIIFHERPPTTEIFEDEVKKLLVFLGAYAYIEKNKEWLNVNLIKAGFGRFLLVKDEKNNLRQWTPRDKTAGGWTDRELIESYVRATESYISRPQLFPDGTTAKDNLFTVHSKPLLHQLLSFNPADTERFDLAVAFCLWCMTIQAFRRVKRVDQDERQMEFVRAFYNMAS